MSINPKTVMHYPFPWTIAEVNPVSSGSPQSDPGTRPQDPLPQSGYTVYLDNPQLINLCPGN